jgi:hypothetical protein
MVAETKGNYGSSGPDKDIGRNLSEETRGESLGQRLDEGLGGPGEVKSRAQQPKVGEEGDAHDAAVRLQP